MADPIYPAISFRFVLGLFVIVIIVLVVLYIKHRTKERSRHRRRRRKFLYTIKFLLTLPQTTNFRFSQTERVADDNFKFYENARKFPRWVENTAGREEIARYEQFLLFPQRFQKT